MGCPERWGTDGEAFEKREPDVTGDVFDHTVLMAYGSETVDGKDRLFGFFGVKDWLASVILSFPAPWSLEPLEGKYYGTVVADARGKPVLSFWETDAPPSVREKAAFGAWTREAWAEYCCDCHWESEDALGLAERVIRLRNRFKAVDAPDVPKELLELIVERARWCEDVWPELLCGGPDRRVIRAR